MRVVDVKIVGRTPLLMHWDNLEWADDMEAWKNKAANKAASKAGDDRTPAWRWIGSLYNDGSHAVMPSDNVMRALMEAGAMVPTGKGKSTFKAKTQSGSQPMAPSFALIVHGKPLPYGPIAALRDETSFANHKAAVKDLGFELSVKRATIGQSKHVRVRPMFSDWATTISLAIIDDQIDNEALAQILDCAGRFKGLGDWRPGSPKRPGPYGQFEASIN
jgi:hypothetical protein